mmetsp:Transcript_13633/g.33016  ORF Transcript_13633/g.33016 Transcript_13633/m.33016 type:complete len:145 (+) Transcript_13633:726-1160(+)
MISKSDTGTTARKGAYVVVIVRSTLLLQAIQTQERTRYMMSSSPKWKTCGPRQLQLQALADLRTRPCHQLRPGSQLQLCHFLETEADHAAGKGAVCSLEAVGMQAAALDWKMLTIRRVLQLLSPNRPLSKTGIDLAAGSVRPPR